MDYLRRLKDVHPNLVAPIICGAAAYEAATNDRSVRVTSGFRTEAEQRALVAAGKSRTMRSYHRRGLAVDLAILMRGTTAVWDHSMFEDLNGYIQREAVRLGVHLTWGGDWSSFVDAVHWQLEVPSFDPQW